MKWRPWRERERLAARHAAEAAAELERIKAQRAAVEAQRAEVRDVSRALTRQTIEVNGWTRRAKRAFS